MSEGITLGDILMSCGVPCRKGALIYIPIYTGSGIPLPYILPKLGHYLFDRKTPSPHVDRLYCQFYILCPFFPLESGLFLLVSKNSLHVGCRDPLIILAYKSFFAYNLSYTLHKFLLVSCLTLFMIISTYFFFFLLFTSFHIFGHSFPRHFLPLVTSLQTWAGEAFM